MSGGYGKCSRIQCIVRLCQMLRRWRNKARMSSAAAAAAAANRVPSDVPPGHVAVCVGRNSRRYVVKATYLNHPFFKKLLNGAEEEYEFCNTTGPLAIPCEESLFEEVLRLISSRSGKTKLKFDEFHHRNYCNGGYVDFWKECRPLLQGFTITDNNNNKTIC